MLRTGGSVREDRKLHHIRGLRGTKCDGKGVRMKLKV